MSESQGDGGVTRFGAIFVGGSGVAVTAASLVGEYFHGSSGTTVAGIITGALLIVAAPVLTKLKTIKFGATGGELVLAEQQTKTGELVDAKDVIDVTAIDLPPSTPSEVGPAHKTKAIEGPEVIATTDTDGNLASSVYLTDEAVTTLRSLDPPSTDEVRRALRTLGRERDRRFIEPGTGGQSYYTRRIRDDLRLVYRPLDKTSEEDPDRYVVLTIET